MRIYKTKTWTRGNVSHFCLTSRVSLLFPMLTRSHSHFKRALMLDLSKPVFCNGARCIQFFVCTCLVKCRWEIATGGPATWYRQCPDVPPSSGSLNTSLSIQCFIIGSIQCSFVFHLLCKPPHALSTRVEEMDIPWYCLPCSTPMTSKDSTHFSEIPTRR